MCSPSFDLDARLSKVETSGSLERFHAVRRLKFLVSLHNYLRSRTVPYLNFQLDLIPPLNKARRLEIGPSNHWSNQMR